MSAISRLFTVLLIGLLPLPSLAGGSALLHGVESVFKAGRYVKVTRLTSLTAHDLRYASKVDNINGLLELAEQEQRIDPVQMMQLSRRFTAVANGDHMLLACLQHSKCRPETFVEVIKTSRLHAEVAKRNPSLGLINAHHTVGALNENLMIRYFEKSGWTLSLS